MTRFDLTWKSTQSYDPRENWAMNFNHLTSVVIFGNFIPLASPSVSWGKILLDRKYSSFPEGLTFLEARDPRGVRGSPCVTAHLQQLQGGTVLCVTALLLQLQRGTVLWMNTEVEY